MLILTRKLNEEIHIGGGIIIKVLGFEREPGHDRVKIGIEAPPNVSILREELGPNRGNRRDG